MIGRRLIVAAALGAALVTGLPAAAAAQQPACGDVITEDTTLTADIRCDLLESEEEVPAAALTIGADNVTLDMAGYTLVGYADLPRVMIQNLGYDGVTIRDGNITGGGDTMLLEGVKNNEVIDLSGRTDYASGITLRDSHQNALRRLDVIGFAGGSLYLDASHQNLIVDSALNGRTLGADLSSSHLNRIVRSELDAESGLGMSESHFNVVADTSVSGSFFSGASVSGSVNTFTRTTFYGGNPFGDDQALELTGTANKVRDSIFRGPSSPNFVLRGGSENVIRRNSFGGEDYPFSLPADGLLIEAAAVNTKLVRNLAEDYSDDGFDVESPSTILRYNSANDNGDLGIEAVPGVRGTGNVATGNGNPLQCLNIACAAAGP